MKKYIVISRKVFWSLIFGTLLSVAFLVNEVHQVSAKNNGDDYELLRSFTDVLALVQKNYVEKVEVKKLVEGAIKGMLLTLDPHSSYLSDDIYKELQVETRGEFGGLGIEITVKDGLLTVVAPIEDSPAAKAGVKAGDQIVKIADEFTKHLSLVEAVKKMRGPKGTPITISVLREGQSRLIPITVIRDIIKVKSVRFRELEPGFGYIRLSQFQEASASEFKKALNKLKEKFGGKELDGLVIDLRDNPGGLLTQAIRISDIFLKDGVIVYTDGRLESQKQKYFAHDDANEPTFPIIVLVNGGSASASEIVAGALQDHGKALILGTKTFGKGSVQTILPMDTGTALRLTTALYFTKSGRSIQAQGVAPDVIVSPRRYPKDSEEVLEEDESLVRGEKDLPGAIKNPTEEMDEEELDDDVSSVVDDEDELRIGSRKAITADLRELLKVDPQLEEALHLLKTWKVFKGRPEGKKAAEVVATSEAS